MLIGDYVRCFQSEWLKKKRSLGSWLIVVGALFTPTIIVVARMLHRGKLPALYAASNFWTSYWRSSWESMAIFFLPMAAILVTSLIVQIEYRNNAWKQVNTLPLSLTTIYFSKLAVVLVLMAEFFILFDVAVYVSAMVPATLLGNVSYPRAHLPLRDFVADTGRYWVASLPIVVAQYVLSLRFRNFLVPVGVGFMAWVGALAALSWKDGYILPYIYTMLAYLRDDPKTRITLPASQLNAWSIGYAVCFTLAGYLLFVNKQQKG
jgi:hypothetical protein